MNVKTAPFMITQHSTTVSTVCRCARCSSVLHSWALHVWQAGHIDSSCLLCASCWDSVIRDAVSLIARLPVIDGTMLNLQSPLRAVIQTKSELWLLPLKKLTNIFTANVCFSCMTCLWMGTWVKTALASATLTWRQVKVKLKKLNVWLMAQL